jgi:hypothetical protein
MDFDSESIALEDLGSFLNIKVDEAPRTQRLIEFDDGTAPPSSSGAIPIRWVP